MRALAPSGVALFKGGLAHVAPERVTPAWLGALDALVSLDPLHLPHNLARLPSSSQAATTGSGRAGSSLTGRQAPASLAMTAVGWLG